MPSIAVEVVAFDDCRAALGIYAGRSELRGEETRRGSRTFVCRAIGRVVAALDAGPIRRRLEELDIVLVTKTLAALGVALPARSAAGVVLAALVPRVQAGEVARADASGDWQHKRSQRVKRIWCTGGRDSRWA